MKTNLIPAIVVTWTLAAFLCGCASTTPRHAPSTAQPKTRVGDISNPEAENTPSIGMTKAQVLARYGEPKRHTITDEGENWIYILNFGEVMGKAMIPFNFKPTPIRTGVIIFGPDSRVKKFNWDIPTEG